LTADLARRKAEEKRRCAAEEAFRVLVSFFSQPFRMHSLRGPEGIDAKVNPRLDTAFS
jgi:hypothetical protein